MTAGLNRRVIFFSALAAVGYVVMFQMAFRQPAIADPALQDSRCLNGPFPHAYTFLHPELNNVICYANTMFKSLSFSSESTMLADSFARWVFTAAAIVSCETFRTGQPFIVKRGLWFLYLAQIMTGAVVLPIYFAVLCWYGSKHNPPKAPILAERAWATLLSLGVCYLTPTAYVRSSNWSYDALLLWQIFPLYLMVAQTVLPVLLKPFLGRTPASVPLFLIGLTGVGLSASGHFDMLSKGESLKDVFLPWLSGAEGLTAELHIFFADDYAICAFALGSYLVLAYGGHGLGSKILTLLALVVMSVLVGPGGAAAAVWASTVIFNPEKGKVDEHQD